MGESSFLVQMVEKSVFLTGEMSRSQETAGLGNETFEKFLTGPFTNAIPRPISPPAFSISQFLMAIPRAGRLSRRRKPWLISCTGSHGKRDFQIKDQGPLK